MNIKRLLALIITAPVWLPLYVMFMIIGQSIGQLIQYGWTGNWKKWDWKL
ncbi:MAG: hypothetical protein ACTSUP_00385 [Candidatus Heimdallarchaeaceae archaeon]